MNIDQGQKLKLQFAKAIQGKVNRQARIAEQNKKVYLCPLIPPLEQRLSKLETKADKKLNKFLQYRNKNKYILQGRIPRQDSQNSDEFGSDMYQKKESYRNATMYSALDVIGGQNERYKTPCHRLERRDLQKTYHDPEHQKSGGGGIIKLNSFLGIDSRGERALSTLKHRVRERNMGPDGSNTGRGLLGPNIKKRSVDLSVDDEELKQDIKHHMSNASLDFSPRTKLSIFAGEDMASNSGHRHEIIGQSSVKLSAKNVSDFKYQTIYQGQPGYDNKKVQNTKKFRFGSPQANSKENLASSPSLMSLSSLKFKRNNGIELPELVSQNLTLNKMSSRDKVPDYVKRNQARIAKQSRQISNQKKEYRIQREEALVPIVKTYKTRIQQIPEEFLSSVHKKQLMENKDQQMQRTIQASMGFKFIKNQ